MNLTEIMPNSVLISVIIPTYNHEKYVAMAVRSALEQKNCKYEVIVVDDGSTDKTKNVLAQYMDKITYIYQENKGLSAARNTGIRAARGEFIAFLDADDEWLPQKLEYQLTEISKSVRIGIVGCGKYFINQHGNIIGEPKVENYKTRSKLLSKLYLGNVVSGGSGALVRKECFDKVGLFDESLRAAEDWEMWLRISMHYGISFVEKPLVKIRVSNTSMSGSSNADKMLNNELVVLDKFFSAPEIRNNNHLKAKAYSYRYYKAAIAYKENGDMQKMKYYIKKSIKSYPAHLFNERILKFFVRNYLIR